MPSACLVLVDANTDVLVSWPGVGSCLFLNVPFMFFPQKPNDNQEQVMKKRKKKDLSNVDKPPKKNRVPKQG